MVEEAEGEGEDLLSPLEEEEDDDDCKFLPPLEEGDCEDDDAPSPRCDMASPLDDEPWSNDDSDDEDRGNDGGRNGANNGDEDTERSLRNSSTVRFRFSDDGEGLECLDDSDDDDNDGDDSNTSITEDDLMEDGLGQEDLFESLHSALSSGGNNNCSDAGELKQSLGLDDLERSAEEMEFIEDLIAKADKYMSCPDFDAPDECSLSGHRLAVGEERRRAIESESDGEAFVPAAVVPDSLRRRLRRSADYTRHANSSSTLSADSNVSELTSSFTRSAPALHQHSDVIRLEYERRILRDRIATVPKFSESWFSLKEELVEVDAYLEDEVSASVHGRS